MNKEICQNEECDGENIEKVAGGHIHTQPENWKEGLREVWISLFGLPENQEDFYLPHKYKPIVAFIEETLAARDREWIEKIQKANLTTHCKMHVPCESCALLVLNPLLQSYQTNK
jgi:hypothetical protein